jgi:formate/nitrite transporter
LVLALLAGIYIAFGAIFSTLSAAGASGVIPHGITRIISGLVFTVGLILVVVGGAELFTGNNLMVMAWADRQISTGKLLRNWVLVYAGNFIGSVLMAFLVFQSGHYASNGGSIGLSILSIAETKTSLPFIHALSLGVLCNILVCLAVWLSYSAKSVSGKILAIIPPISAFVAAGFEHSVANMYFIPMGLLVKFGVDGSFWNLIQKTPADFPHLTVSGILVNNLLPVSLGNIIGGLMIGLAYWFIYLYRK